MGLLDSVLGGTPANSGLSAATKALLIVLAAKAAKDYLAKHQQAQQGAGGAPNAGGLGGMLNNVLGGGAPGGTASAPGSTGGLGGILGSILGGGQSGGAAGGLGSILGGAGGGLGGLLGGLGGAGALGALVSQFQQAGHGDAVKSWMGTGGNQPIAPAELEKVLGPGPLGELEARTGMPRQAILQQLAHELPTAMDQITPRGRLPTDDELAAHAGPYAGA